MSRKLLIVFLACMMLVPAPPLQAQEDPALPYTVEGYTLTIHEGVQALGYDAESWIACRREEEPPNVPLVFDRSFLPLKRVVFPSTLRHLSSTSFFGYTFSSLTLPEGLEDFDADCFYYCTIGTLELPSTLCLQWGALLEQAWVSRVEVSEAHPDLKSVDGILYSRDGSILYYYPNQRQDTFFEVPAGVRRIWDYAFAGNHYLQSITLPLGLVRIDEGAFSDCGRLSSIALPLTLEYLGDYAFSDCVSLQRVSPHPGMALLTSVFLNCPLLSGSSAFEGDEGGNEQGPVAYETRRFYFNRWGRNLVASGEGQVQVRQQPRPDSPVVATLPDWTNVYNIGELKGDWVEITWVAWQQGTQAEEWQRTGFVPVQALRPCPGSEGNLFTLFSACPKNPQVQVYEATFANREEALSRPIGGLAWQDFRLEDYTGSVWGDWLAFYYPDNTEDDEGWVTMDERPAFASAHDFTYTRLRNGDERMLCLLLPHEREEPLLLEPGGQTIASLIIGTQAEVLQQEADFTRIRVRGQEGYVRTASVVLVPQADE